MHDNRTNQGEVSAPWETRQVRYLIAEGLRWTVQEVAAPALDRRGGVHLVFDGELVMRRIRSFTADWYTLSDEELYALTDQIRA